MRPFRDLVYTMPPYVTSDARPGPLSRRASSAPWRRCTAERPLPRAADRMSRFLDDLAARAAERERLGLTRHLVPRRPATATGAATGAAAGVPPEPPLRTPRSRSTSPATTTSGCCAHPAVIAGAVAAARDVRRRGRGLTAGHRHARRARGAGAALARLPEARQRPGPLHRVRRQPRRAHHAGRRRHPGRHRRPRARQPDRRRRLSRAPRGRGRRTTTSAAVERLLGRRPRPGPWSSSSRSTRCSATPPRWPTSPRSPPRHGAMPLVDEAHGLGVVGDHGQGLVAAAGISPDRSTWSSPPPCRSPSAPRAARCSATPSCASTWSTPPARSSTTPGWRPPRPAPRWPPCGCCATTPS